MTNVAQLAQELADAHAACRPISPPSSREGGLDLATAYAVEAEYARRRRAAGRTAVGRKVGFANKAMWRILKLETLVWARMYDDTVHDAAGGEAVLPLAGRCAPKIEPEIVFKLARPVPDGAPGPGDALAAVAWLALGFEINDCVFPGWTFQPADFVAAFGLHTALVVGPPRPIEPESIPALVGELARFTLTLSRHGEPVEEGAGRNALRSPALCLAELSAAIARQPGAEPLAAGELVSTGTLTAPHTIAAGEVWRAECHGLDLPPLTLRV
jgi:2-oxo-3-hexenedioate decarboxylase